MAASTGHANLSGDSCIVGREGSVEHGQKEETMNLNERQQPTQGKMNFRCSDIDASNCDWQVSGNNEEEILSKVEQHAREKHHMTVDEDTRRRVRIAIQRKAA